MSSLIGLLNGLTDYVDLGAPSLYVSAASIAFNPLFWNIVARQEYHNKILTRLFGGRSLHACYALAATIFSIGIVRDYLYKVAITAQPTAPILASLPSQALGYTLLICGNILVVSSTWALGITGTFLGDYFGILMDKMVTGFPFNLVSAPMYWGSTMSFAGTAFVFGKPAGLILTTWVLVVYLVALGFEDPFTSEIYAKRERELKEGKKSK